MDISSIIGGADYTRLQNRVDVYNKTLQDGGRAGKNSLDKDDFLRILITQLTHQDPTQLMEDREFVAQMAQFSALEQMTNLNREFSRVAGLIAANQAMALIGKTVEVADGEAFVTGVVQEVTGGDFPQIMIDGKYYDYDQVKRVKG